jgi:hypothetical protein
MNSCHKFVAINELNNGVAFYYKCNICNIIGYRWFGEGIMYSSRKIYNFTYDQQDEIDKISCEEIILFGVLV